MSFLLARSIISSGKLGDAGNVFAANLAAINGTKYFNCGNDASLQITGNLSCAGWVQLAATGGDRYIFSKWNSVGNQRGWHLRYNGSAFHIEIDANGTGSDVTLDSVLNPSASVLYHVGFTYDGSDVRIFINGAEDNSVAYSGGIHNSTNAFLIGAVNNGIVNWNGDQGFAGIWDEALVEADFATMCNAGVALCYDELSAGLKTDLVSYWHLSNWSGSTGTEIEDRHGSNDATNVNSIAFTGTGLNVECTPVTTFAANLSDLNGTSQSFTLGDVLDVGTGNVSNSIWFKTNAGASQMLMTKIGNATPAAWQLWIDASGQVHFDFEIDASNRYLSFETTTTGFDDNAWHLVTADSNRAGGEPIIMIDGAIEAVSGGTLTGSVSTGDNSNTAALQFGRRDIGASPVFFNGNLSFAAYSLESLTLTDHQNMYNSGVSLCESELLSLHSSTHAKLAGFWDLANWSGSPGTEIEDKIAANDATNTGTILFTGSGLDVECT